MDLNEQLLSAYRDAVQSASDAEELEEVVGTLPEDYEDALADEIEERRSELESAESIALDDVTRAELLDLLDTRPELRSAVMDHLEAEDSPENGDEPGPGDPPDPAQDEGQPGPDSAEDDVVTDATDDWESAGSRDLDATGDPDGEWDGTDALDQLFDLAEGEDGEIDESVVKRGVAAFDSTSDGQNKEDYKGPFAVVNDGEPVAHLAGADSLKQMASQMDVPESVQDDAEDLADSYLPEDDSEEDTEDVDDTGETDTTETDEDVEDDLTVEGDLEIEDGIVLGDRLDGLVEVDDGKLSLQEGSLLDEGDLGTLVDAAEGLGAEVGEDPDPSGVIAAINEQAQSLDGRPTADDSATVGARVLFDRLERYNITT